MSLFNARESIIVKELHEMLSKIWSTSFFFVSKVQLKWKFYDSSQLQSEKVFLNYKMELKTSKYKLANYEINRSLSKQFSE